MSINGTPIEAGFYTTTQLPIEALYMNGGEPWANEAEALAGIPSGARYKYMIININGDLYWFLDDLITLELLKNVFLQTAEEVPIDDVLDYYAAENVEDALAEIGAALVAMENPFSIVLSASASVAGKISGAVVPAGWALAVDDSVNLKITHTVNNRLISNITVFEIDGTEKRQCIPFSEAYTGVVEISDSEILVEGINPTALPLHIFIFFS